MSMFSPVTWTQRFSEFWYRDCLPNMAKQKPKLSFEELYRSAYNMVLHKFGSYLYDNVVRTISAHLETVGREVETKNGEAFLQLLVHSWSDYTRAMRNIRDILMYMNKTYVKQHSKTPIHELGLELWNEHLLQRPLVRSILKQVILEAVLKFRSCRGDRKKVESHQGNPLITAVTKSVTVLRVVIPLHPAPALLPN